MMDSKSNLNRLWVFSAVILLGMFVLAAWAWQQLPANASIPVHWGINGAPNRYGGKWEGLFLLPLITAGIAVLFTLILYIDPLRQNIQQSGKAYAVTWVALLLFMAGLHIVTVLIALGWAINISVVITIALGILFIVMGNYMGKIRRNYTFGIRTPWTLASDVVWDKTHRLGGKVFMVAGLLILLSAFFANGLLHFYIMLGALLGAVALVVVYSYWVWRNDPAPKTEL
ncbi:MAG: SdpI family protein [Caldilineaceae bacterium]